MAMIELEDGLEEVVERWTTRRNGLEFIEQQTIRRIDPQPSPREEKTPRRKDEAAEIPFVEAYLDNLNCVERPGEECCPAHLLQAAGLWLDGFVRRWLENDGGSGLSSEAFCDLVQQAQQVFIVAGIGPVDALWVIVSLVFFHSKCAPACRGELTPQQLAEDAHWCTAMRERGDGDPGRGILRSLMDHGCPVSAHRRDRLKCPGVLIRQDDWCSACRAEGQLRGMT